jgi:hypothetical protein
LPFDSGQLGYWTRADVVDDGRHLVRSRVGHVLVVVGYSLALVELALGELFGDLVGADAALDGGRQA